MQSLVVSGEDSTISTSDFCHVTWCRVNYYTRMLQGWQNKVVTILFNKIMIVLPFLEQLRKKSDNINKVVTSC